jgi:hypothetical protein
MQNNFDIAKFIEKNPIACLSKDYQNKLINQIIENFTELQQKMFVSSFYCYLNYNSKKDFIIDLDDVWKWVGFSRKDHAKRLLEKYFVDKIDYKISLPFTGERFNEENKEKQQNIFSQLVENAKGGQNKEKILMTVNTFKKFCLKANTKKSDEIHDYYIHLEELLQETINKQTNELRDQLQIKDKQMEEKNANHKLELKMKRHNTLVEILRTKRCVYAGEIGKIGEIGEIIESDFIKIGSSKGIDDRTKQLNKQYGNFIFLEAFECENFREVEESILQDSEIKKNLYDGPIKLDGSASREVVKLSENFTYDKLLSIIKKHVDSASTHFFTPAQILEKQKIELKNKKLDHDLFMAILNNDKYSEKIQTVIDDVFPGILLNISKNKSENMDPKVETKIKTKVNTKKDKICAESDSETESDSELEFESNKYDKIDYDRIDYNKLIKKKPMNKKIKGRKVQQIDPINLKNIIKIYDTMNDLLRDPKNKGLNRTSIMRASEQNKTYKDYRWNIVEHGDDATVSNVKPSINDKKTSTIETILQLNDTKTEILDSFSSKKFLVDKLKMTEMTMRRIINSGKKFNNCYYIEKSKCPKDLLDKYDKKLNKYISSQAKQIKQINLITKEEIVFNSLNEIKLKFGFCPNTIKKAIENKTMFASSMWEFYTNK